MYRLEKKQEKEAKKKAREAKREEKAAEAAQKLADNAARKPQDPKAKPRASKSNKSVGTKLRRKAALDSDGDRYMELSTEFVRLSDDEDSWEVSDPETSEDEGTVDESSGNKGSAIEFSTSRRTITLNLPILSKEDLDALILYGGSLIFRYNNESG